MESAQKYLGSSLFQRLMQATFFGHFTAGQNELQLRRTIDRLAGADIRPMVNYTFEDTTETEYTRR